jgi:hypothetical protein
MFPARSFNLELIFCLLLFEGAFTSFFKDKKSYGGRKTVGIKFCLMIEGSRSVPLTNGSGSGRPKNTYRSYGSGFGAATLQKINNASPEPSI